jgi:hypothetical protein
VQKKLVFAVDGSIMSDATHRGKDTNKKKRALFMPDIVPFLETGRRRQRSA